MKLIVLTILLSAGASLIAQSNNLKISSFSGDTCQQGDVIELSGEIYNPTNEVVQLLADNSNSLLNAALAGREIASGEHMKFKFPFDTKGKYGDVSGSERIRSSDRKWGYSFHWKVYVKADKMPKMTFDEVLVTRDSIPRGGDGLFEYHFTNTGNLPLIINRVNSSCGCLVPSYDREPIMPGEKGVIKGHYDTKRIGPINKSLTIRSNAEHPVIVVRLKGSVFASKEWIEEQKILRLKRQGVRY